MTRRALTACAVFALGFAAGCVGLSVWTGATGRPDLAVINAGNAIICGIAGGVMLELRRGAR